MQLKHFFQPFDSSFNQQKGKMPLTTVPNPKIIKSFSHLKQTEFATAK